MAKRHLPTPHKLRQLLRYEPDTGRFFWRVRTPEMFEPRFRTPEHQCKLFNRNFAEKEAFTSDSGHGYLQSSIEGKGGFRAHRVAFAIMTGRWPVGEIDHINGKRNDNRWINLREVPASENAKNKRQSEKSTCLFLGVSQTRNGKWRARIKIGRQEIHIGTYTTPEEAISARKKAQREHGFHANHGNP